MRVFLRNNPPTPSENPCLSSLLFLSRLNYIYHLLLQKLFLFAFNSHILKQTDEDVETKVCIVGSHLIQILFGTVEALPRPFQRRHTPACRIRWELLDSFRLQQFDVL